MWWRKNSFAVVLTCADWRLHQPRVRLHQQLCRTLRVHGLYINAIPGPDGLLERGREQEWTAVVEWSRLLAGRPFIEVLAVVAHQACIAHAVSDEQHEADARRVAEALKRELAFAKPMTAFVAIRHSDANWSLKEIAKF